MLGSFGVTELIIILVIVMVLFGAKRLPDLAKGLGQGITEFKKASRNDSSEEEEDTTTKSTNTPASKDS
ncbi:MAG: twin-arginine translocase TatA/TatE family subunit [Candidatus Latescibacteria bacterium]|jgi:sec-independent protein translocase protein TatA|nr:twin-arginine translocase TatA/TatE family subunit [Candidatus Latescibacterota bacterium]MDP7239051.1 twin-arginine translocase TatA/TatE family subunit [Candidatus Latescibacterota bacterium]